MLLCLHSVDSSKLILRLFFLVICYKNLQPPKLAFRPNYILSLKTFSTNIGPYEIFYTVIYVTSIHLTENRNVAYYCYLRAIFFLFLTFKISNVGQIKTNILRILKLQIFTYSQR